MAYVLEEGTLQVVPMGYSYMRRAQATLHRTIWKQIAVSDERQPLRDLANHLRGPLGAEYRITGVGPHALFNSERVMISET